MSLPKDYTWPLLRCWGGKSQQGNPRTPVLVSSDLQSTRSRFGFGRPPEAGKRCSADDSSRCAHHPTLTRSGSGPRPRAISLCPVHSESGGRCFAAGAARRDPRFRPRAGTPLLDDRCSLRRQPGASRNQDGPLRGPAGLVTYGGLEPSRVRVRQAAHDQQTPLWNPAEGAQGSGTRRSGPARP